MAEKVLIDDLETSDEDIFIGVTYRGKPFTGTAVDESDGYAEYRYLDGCGHGRCFSRYLDGQMEDEFFLDHGKMISETCWYGDGSVKSRFTSDPLLHQDFLPDGTLIREETAGYLKTWYDSGALKQDFSYSDLKMTCYAPDGTWIARQNGQQSNRGKAIFVMERSSFQFNDPFLRAHYLELLEDPDFYPFFLRWLPEPPRHPPARRDWLPKLPKKYEAPSWVREVVCAMISSENLSIKNDGISLAEAYAVQEARPLLRQCLGCRQIPLPAYYRGGSGCSLTIAQRASAALKNISPQHSGNSGQP